MRIVIIGGSDVAVQAARLLLGRGDDVVVIESERERVEELSEMLDCGFLHGDGSNPSILREAGPGQTDVLICVTDNDQVNIIASLVGRSLGFERVITSIRDPAFERICQELGLEETIVPGHAIARHLSDMCHGAGAVELAPTIRGKARLFSFFARPEDVGPVESVALPEASRIVCYYRDDAFHLASEGTRLKEGDEVVVLTDSAHLEALREIWRPKQEQETERPAERSD
jgi:trk system potassium uptake protein TrkA